MKAPQRVEDRRHWSFDYVWLVFEGVLSKALQWVEDWRHWSFGRVWPVSKEGLSKALQQVQDAQVLTLPHQSWPLLRLHFGYFLSGVFEGPTADEGHP